MERVLTTNIYFFINYEFCRMPRVFRQNNELLNNMKTNKDYLGMLFWRLVQLD